jgi:hypothetical protein
MKGCLAYQKTGHCHCGLYGALNEQEQAEFLIEIEKNGGYCPCFPKKNQNTICHGFKEHPQYKA